MHVDSLIHARWVIPIEPEHQVLDRHAIAIKGGHIQAISPSEEAETQITADETLYRDQHVIMPGLINAHTHSPMSLFRGMADDMPLMNWLNEHIWPAEKKWVHEEFVADGTRLSITEMLRGGTTCFNDMYFFPDVTGMTAAHAGIRSVIGLIAIDFPSTWASDADEYLRRAIEVQDHFKGHPLVHTAFAPHAPYSVSDEPLQRIRTLADELEMPIHIHLHETQDEIQQSLEQHGCRPIERLDRLGLLSPELIAVHMTHLEEDEIERIANSGSHVVHCPESNLKLASGFCPTTQLLEAGIRVALGTDGAASNNDLDMLSEMHTAALLGKGTSGDPKAIPAHQVLEMATINGAKALGLDHLIGSITKGKYADMIAIDLGQPETSPVFHPASQIVYAAGREQVTDTWVAGKQLLRDRALTSIDMDETVERANYWRDEING